MPGDERPDLAALAALEDVLRHLEAELAAWRRRALAGESRAAELLRALEAGDDAPSRSKQLEEQGRELAVRLDAARGRVNDMIARLAFLEQQSGNGGGAGE
jgi:hypothetical protein